MRPIDQGFIAHEDLIDVARSWLLPNTNGSGACAVPFEAILMAAVAGVQVLLFALGASDLDHGLKALDFCRDRL
jgi:hypothetical protein